MFITAIRRYPCGWETSPQRRYSWANASCTNSSARARSPTVSRATTTMRVYDERYSSSKLTLGAAAGASVTSSGIGSITPPMAHDPLARFPDGARPLASAP